MIALIFAALVGVLAVGVITQNAGGNNPPAPQCPLRYEYVNGICETDDPDPTPDPDPDPQCLTGWHFSNGVCVEDQQPDSIAPTVTISSPANGISLPAGTTTTTVSGTASDNVGLSKVELSVNNGVYATMVGTTSWRAQVNDMQNGQSYILRARAVDTSNNLSQVKSITITVANISCPVGSHLENSLCVQDGSPNPGGSLDQYGVKMIYGTKSGGEQWFMNTNTLMSDARFDGDNDNLSKNLDGSWKSKSSAVRLNVFTSSGYHKDQITTYNQIQLASKGYMQSPNDWKNIEMTGFVKVNTANNDNFAWYARGGYHGNSAGDGGSGCEGTSYKGDIGYGGGARFAKEQWHSGGYSFTPWTSTSPDINDRWVGIKFVMYNKVEVESGKTVVHLENWLNNNADKTSWTKISDVVDRGGFGSDGGHCGGAADQIMTWGGPVATFRWDSASNVDFQFLSVREISAP